MKALVVFYSRTESNKYLAQRLGREFDAKMIELKPRLKGFFWQLVFSGMKISAGNKKIDAVIKDYDKVIICAPIWMGQLAAPMRSFLKKYNKDIKSLHFASSCAGTDADKETKFGYIGVFNQIKEIVGSKLISAEAFSTSLVVNAEDRENSAVAMKVSFNDNNFTGDVKTRFDAFVKKAKEV